MDFFYTFAHMVISREKMIGGVLAAVCLLTLLYVGWLQFGPGAKYRGLTTQLDVQMDDSTRAYLELQLKTDLAAIAAAEAAGEEVNLNLYLAAASNAYSLGDLITAREAIEAQLKANPLNYGALNTYGSILEAMGDYKGARDAYEDAIDASGGKGPEKFFIDEVNLLEKYFPKEQEKIKAVLETAVVTKGQTSWNMVMLGRWYLKQADCQSAIEHFETAQKLSPNNQGIKDELQGIKESCK